MLEGKSYFDACEAVGYDHSGYKTIIPLQEKLDPVFPNELRNPVAEQVLNQMVNMVNQAIDQYGRFDEIRVELARDLKNSANARKEIFSKNNKNKRDNEGIRRRLKEEYGMAAVNGRDVQRYKLWESTEHICIYCNKPITQTAFLSGQVDTDHILPKSRSFSNAMDNFVLTHYSCNREKGQQTAFDFMRSKGDAALELYLKSIQELFEKKKISRTKMAYLTSTGDEIPKDFVERMLKDTQYIVTAAVKRLKTICEKTYTTTGQITDLLRREWDLNRVLEELNLPKYKLVGLTEQRIKKGNGDSSSYEAITDWTKRNDHRHHAIDALITALTDPKIVFRLNNLNKLYQMEKGKLSAEDRKALEEAAGGRFDLKEFADQTAVRIPCPVQNLRHLLREELKGLLVSYKKTNSKVLSLNFNKIRIGKGQHLIQPTWVPRGSLHNDTIMGLRKVPVQIPIQQLENLDDILHPDVKAMVMDYTAAFGHSLKKAFAKKNLSQQPLLWKGKPVEKIWVNKIMISKRVKLAALTDNQVKNIADLAISQKVTDWVEKYGGLEAAKASLQEMPLYLNDAAGIRIERVTVLENKNSAPLRHKRDHFGSAIQEGGIPADFADLSNNHHALVYQNEQGLVRSRVISFWEAVETGLHNIREKGKPYPVISRHRDGEFGTLKFSMQINDLFTIDLFHAENPVEDNEINFLDPVNRVRISERLFRVQTLSTTGSGQIDILLRHHLETSVKNRQNELRGIVWERFQSDKHLSRLTKVKINHLGEIIKIGE
jgi:CRISPR-associated endonuclease Csn1